MNKNILGCMVLTLMLSNSFAFAQTGSQQIIILDKGVKRTMNIQTEGTAKNKAYSTNQLTVKKGILVSFKNITNVSIDDFEKKYGLKLKEKMIIGYYIFDNNSNYSDVEIIEKIIADEVNIKSVKPNWKMLNRPM